MDCTYSFIIPHHNSPELLNRCLDSIPAREDIQIIVIDDNSQEDKRPRVTRKDVEILYIDVAHTKGAGHARNVGLAHAQGKWLLFPDCDDYYAEGFLSILEKYAVQNIDVLYFNFSRIIENGLLTDNELQKKLTFFSGTTAEIDFIKYHNNTPWAKMVKREYVLAHNMYFEEVPNGNDVLFSLFVASYTEKIAVIPDRLYYYVKTSGSLATKKQSNKDLKCRIVHLSQHYSINKLISHPEWNGSRWSSCRVVYRRNGLFKLIQLFPFIIWIIIFDKKKKNEWSKIIYSHR